MRINVGDIPQEVACGDDPQIGDVYRVQGGRGYNKRYQMVVGISDNGDTVYLLTFDREGNVVGVQQYGAHYIHRKGRVGRAKIPDIDVVWEGPWA